MPKSAVRTRLSQLRRLHSQKPDHDASVTPDAVTSRDPDDARVELRTSANERGRIERAAAGAGMAVSEFVIQAALDRANVVLGPDDDL